MRFKIAETMPMEVARLSKWHSWFAWFPVKAGAQRVWLERIERRAIYRPRSNVDSLRAAGLLAYPWRAYSENDVIPLTSGYPYGPEVDRFEYRHLTNPSGLLT